MKKTSKNEIGITLIALVVTIIVLLILAGVSIAMLTGEGGILKQAGEARERTGRANIIEQARVDLLEKQTENKGKVSKEDLYEVLNKYFENVPDLENETWNDEETWKKEEVTGKNDKTVKVQIGEIYGGTLGEKGGLTLVEMYENAQRDGCLNEDGTCTNPEHLHIGDYVNYPNPTSGKYTVGEDESVDKDVLGAEENKFYRCDDKTQTYEITSTKNQLNWRVLGKDSETGGIKLIAGSPMKSNNTINSKEYPYLCMYGAKAYTNSVEQLNNICKLYSTDLGTARSVTIKDIDEIVGITEEKIKELNETYGESYSFEDQYTPENWLNEKTPTKIFVTHTSYSYGVGLDVSGNLGFSPYKRIASIGGPIRVAEDDPVPDITVTTRRAYCMLFDGLHSSGSAGTGKEFWTGDERVFKPKGSEVATFGVGTAKASSGVAFVDTYGLFCSDGREWGYDLAVRPVVLLKFSVSSKEVQKMGDRSEETWDYPLMYD